MTLYKKAPERVLAVYQGCIETMIALGLEDHVIASYGLDNEIKDEWEISRTSTRAAGRSPDSQADIGMSKRTAFPEGWHEAEIPHTLRFQ